MGLLLTIAAFVVLGGGGSYFAVSGAAYLSTHLDLTRSGPDDVRQVTEESGEVELTGTARAHDGPDRAPFTGAETLVHEWRVFDDGGPESEAKHWGTETRPFLLAADTGTVLVDPDEQPPKPVAEFLASSDRLSADPLSPRRYRESRLTPATTSTSTARSGRWATPKRCPVASTPSSARATHGRTQSTPRR